MPDATGSTGTTPLRPPRRRRAALAPLAGLATAALLATGLPPAAAAPAATAAPERLTSLVNPFIGTQDDGNTFPGASLPFGMVQLSPDTGHTTGYDYRDDRIRGFSSTHISGVGCGLGGDLPMLPTTGPVTQTDYAQYALPFSHEGEEAAPGYYKVPLTATAGTVTAELTATTRTGTARYTFPATTEANVLLNSGQALHAVESSSVRVVDERTVETTVVGSGFCRETEPYTMHFLTRFDRPFAAVGTWAGDEVTAGSRTSTGEGRRGAYVRFDTTTDRTVESTTALSWVDARGARANLAAEGGRTFDAVRAAADRTWEQRLRQVRVQGGTAEQRRTFYSSLYRSLLAPAVGTDVDGRYHGFDGRAHRARGFTYYQTFSLWDTYRTQEQLLSLLAPREMRDMALSLLAVEDQGGWLPRWSYASVETNIMTGDPVTPFLVSAWAQGLLRGHEQDAYRALVENADRVPPAASPYNGRAGNPHYLRHGFVPHVPEATGEPGDFDLQHGASATLEYALADAALATMAEGLGHRRDAARYARRAQSYRNVFDPRTGWFRARDERGLFVGPADPAQSVGFHEGTASQYMWLAQQDVPGLVDLIGGRRETNERLDHFFVYDELLEDPERVAREEWVNSAYSYYGQDTYNPQNEPDLHAPYVYAWTGQPWKTADVVQAAITLFSDGPGGMTGNDDLGTMSAWHVLSAMGIYPSVPGSEVWSLSTPTFDRIDLTLDRRYYPKGSLTITAPGTSREDRYVQSVRLGGTAHARTWVSGDDLRAGKDIAFRVGPEPSRWGTDPRTAPPSLVDAGPAATGTWVGAEPRDAGIPGSAQERTVEVTASVVVQAPRPRTVTVTATAEAPLRAAPARTRATIRSGGLPQTRDVPLRVTVPGGTPAGTYDVTVRVTGGPGGPVTTTVPVLVAPACGEPGGSCPQDLSALYDVDGVATGDARDEGDFDGGGWSFPAEQLPPAGERLVLGRAYVLPPTTGTEPNFVDARGQVVPLEEGSYSALDVLLSAHNGDISGEAVVTYADGSTSRAPLTATDWAAGTPRLGEGTALATSGRYQRDGGSDGLRVSIWHDVVPVDPGRRAVSLTLPDDPRMSVYALSARTPGAAVEVPAPAEAAELAHAAMEEHLAVGDGSGLFREQVPAGGEDREYSFEWPFSQAHVATLDLVGVGGDVGARYEDALAERSAAQEHYWDAAGSTTGLPGYDSYPHGEHGDGGDLFYDDNAWVGLAKVQQHLMTGDAAALARAEEVFELLASGWDEDPAHAAPGGVFWTQAPWSTTRNTVSTMPAAQLAVRLHMVTGEQRYLDWALRAVAWTEEHLQAPDGLFWDNIALDGTVDERKFSYNQGVPVGVYTLLHQATGNAAWLDKAEALAAASHAHYVDQGRVDGQPVFFNSIWFKNLLLLESVTGGTTYRAAMEDYADRQWRTYHDPATGLVSFGGSTELLEQAAVVQLYAALAWPRERVGLLY